MIFFCRMRTVLRSITRSSLKRFPGEIREFVDSKNEALVVLWCLIAYADVHTGERISKSLFLIPLSVEPPKPRVVYNTLLV